MQAREKERGADHLVWLIFETWSALVYVVIGGWRTDQYIGGYGQKGKNLGETVVV